jgi:C4-dicarboxylate-specific signal transduction histidine kinase
MKNTPQVSTGLFAFPGAPLLICVLVGVLCTLVVLWILQTNADLRGHTELAIKLEKLREQLPMPELRNQAMANALLMGLNDPVIKRAALGELGLDNAEVMQQLNIARKHFDFEAMYVVDKQGLIVANDTDGNKSTGTNVAFRPYFHRAMKGDDAMYMAIGTHTNSRGLFVAAPIRESTDSSSVVVGVMLIKISAEEHLEKLLRGIVGEVLVITPQGVVFASSRTEWEFAVIPSIDDRGIQEIRDLQQFGLRFAKVGPAPLGFDPLQPQITL